MWRHPSRERPDAWWHSLAEVKRLAEGKVLSVDRPRSGDVYGSRVSRRVMGGYMHPNCGSR